MENTEEIKKEQEAAQADCKPEKPAEEQKKGRKEKKADEAKAQIAELTDKLAAEKASYLRLMAEFETFRRRTAEEKIALTAGAAASTIKGLLPVLDDCERALQILANSSDEAAREGTSLIYTKLMDYLRGCGLEVIDARGKDFDTDFHEAVTQFPAPSEDMKGKVMDVVQTGYILNGKVLRYAKVVVGA